MFLYGDDRLTEIGLDVFFFFFYLRQSVDEIFHFRIRRYVNTATRVFIHTMIRSANFKVEYLGRRIGEN